MTTQSQFSSLKIDMFGYILPLQSELRVRELERFKALYCGLCHTLGKRYGTFTRLLLSYDFVFLAMLLWPADESCTIRKRRCIASPLKRKRCCVANDALTACAAYSIVLTWWKLKDTMEDEGFLRSIPDRIVALLIKKSYKKAAGEYPEFNSAVSEHLNALRNAECDNTATLDSTTDKFAVILRGLGSNIATSEMLYHIGRWIYLIDAVDDFEKDVKKGRYNPVADKLRCDGNSVSAATMTRLQTTMTHSANLAGLAYELTPKTTWSETVRNVISLGMPAVCGSVCEGTWKKPKRRKGIGQ